MTDEAFRLALALQAPTYLGAHDRVHVGTCLAHAIRTIVSADASFDGIGDLARIDPLDSSAIQQLRSR